MSGEFSDEFSDEFTINQNITMSRIDDGFSTLIGFSRNANVKLWEKDITPPGISGGGSTDTTTMRNRKWRTMSPKKLKTLTPCSFNAAYDPAIIVQLNNMVGVNQLITITFADGSLLNFWGFLDEFKPGSITEGTQPTAAVTIIPSNQDETGAEVDPEFIDSEGDTNDTNNG